MGLDELRGLARDYAEGRISGNEFQLGLESVDQRHEDLVNSIRLLSYETGKHGFRTERGLKNGILLLLDGGDPWNNWDKLN